MRFYMYLVLLCSLLLTNTAFSKVKNEFYVDSLGDNYIVTYSEEGKWVLDHYLIEPNKLQKRVSQNVFESKESLLIFKTKSFSPKLNRKSKAIKSRYVTTELNQKIWEVKNQWDLNWELKYSQWLEKEFNKDFFVKYNLETDCADVAFALRWIFARNNSLPALNTLAGSHVLFGQDSFKSEWQALKRDTLWHKDEVFLAALKYILKHAFTGTLNIDGYPIELNKDSFLVGTIHLTGGHTMIISKLDYNTTETAPIWKLSSTVPSMVRVLNEEMMIDGSMIDRQYGGLFRMRWPTFKDGTWKLVPKEQMPLHSFEQYEPDFSSGYNNFTIALINKLGMKFNPKSIVVKAADSLVDNLKFRINIVEEGYAACELIDCSEGTFEYEEHSTPTRDKRIVAKFKTVSELVENLSSFDTSITPYWEHFKKQANFEVLGHFKSLVELEKLFKFKLISSHPEDPIAQRWAVTPEDMEKTINRRFTSKKLKREALLTGSKVCHGQLDCEKGSSNWNQYNTYEFDLNLVNSIFNSYHKMCELYPCANNKLLIENEINKIPFYISEPTATETQKWGGHILEDEFIVLPSGSNYTQINNEYMLIDNKLFNFKTGIVNSKWGERVESIANVKKQTLAAYDGKKVLYYELGKDISEIHFQKKIERIKWVNNDLLFTEVCDSGEIGSLDCDFYLHLLNSNGKLVEHKKILGVNQISFSEESTTGDDEELIAFTMNSKQTFLYLNKLKVSELTSSSVSNGPLYLVKGNIIYNSYDIQTSNSDLKMIEIQSKKSCSLAVNYNLEYIYNVNKKGNLFFAQTRSPQKYKIFRTGKDCKLEELVEFENENNWSQSFDDTVYVQTNNGKSIIIVKDGVVERREAEVGYQGSPYDRESVYWFKMSPNQESIEDIYTENIITGIRTQLDPNNMKLKCDLDIYGNCLSKDKDFYKYMHYSKSSNSVNIYNEFKDSNRVISTLLSQSSSDSDNEISIFKEQKANIFSGTILNLGEKLIYLK